MGPTKTPVRAIARKGPAAAIQPGDTVAAAAQEMRNRNVGSLIVVNEAGNVVGIISERDIVRRLTASCGDPTKTPVADIMTSELASCRLSTPVSKANLLMVSHHIRHLPVIEKGKVVGMTSSRDILAHQLRVTTAMRASAEETARLIKCLKSLQLDEVVTVIGSEVPKTFGAERWVLCLADNAISGTDGPLVRRMGCPCQEKDLLALEDPEPSRPRPPTLERKVPPACKAHGCAGPRVFIPLGEDERLDEHGKELARRRAFLCMCGLPPEIGDSEEVVQYRGRLMQDILNAALVNATLYEEARRGGLIDPLTGLSLRRVLELKLAEEYDRGLRYGHSFCVAIMDVDNFKSVNDSYGHGVGDEVLRGLAELFQTNIRASDTLVRYGGDEFVVLLPETSLDGAATLLRRIKDCVAKGLFTPDGRGVTISCGVAEWSGQAQDTGGKVFLRADAALYEAKGAGRNRVAAAATTASSK